MRKLGLLDGSSLGALCGLAMLVAPLQSHAAEQGEAETASQRGPTLDEVVVTAQKRTESVQDVPASISVLSAARMERLQAAQLTDYASYIPGFQVDSGGSPGAAQITLRGVNAAPDSGASVGTYIDDSPD